MERQQRALKSHDKLSASVRALLSHPELQQQVHDFDLRVVRRHLQRAHALRVLHLRERIDRSIDQQRG